MGVCRRNYGLSISALRADALNVNTCFVSDGGSIANAGIIGAGSVMGTVVVCGVSIGVITMLGSRRGCRRGCRRRCGRRCRYRCGCRRRYRCGRRNGHRNNRRYGRRCRLLFDSFTGSTCLNRITVYSCSSNILTGNNNSSYRNIFNLNIVSNDQDDTCTLANINGVSIFVCIGNNTLIKQRHYACTVNHVIGGKRIVSNTSYNTLVNKSINIALGPTGNLAAVAELFIASFFGFNSQRTAEQSHHLLTGQNSIGIHLSIANAIHKAGFNTHRNVLSILVIRINITVHTDVSLLTEFKQSSEQFCRLSAGHCSRRVKVAIVIAVNNIMFYPTGDGVFCPMVVGILKASGKSRHRQSGNQYKKAKDYRKNFLHSWFSPKKS